MDFNDICTIWFFIVYLQLQKLCEEVLAPKIWMHNTSFACCDFYYYIQVLFFAISGKSQSLIVNTISANNIATVYLYKQGCTQGGAGGLAPPPNDCF